MANCKKIEFIECELIYPQMFEYLKLLPRLKFSMHFDQTDDRNDFRFLLECDSLSELKRINVNFDPELIAGVLTKNTYCCEIELSKAVSEADQRKIVEVVSFNALVNKSLNFNLKLAKSQYLSIKLLSNLKIKA